MTEYNARVAATLVLFDLTVGDGIVMSSPTGTSTAALLAAALSNQCPDDFVGARAPRTLKVLEAFRAHELTEGETRVALDWIANPGQGGQFSSESDEEYQIREGQAEDILGRIGA